MRQLFRAAIFIIWLLLIVSGYFVFHKPRLEQLAGLPAVDAITWPVLGKAFASTLLNIGAALCVFLSSLGLGGFLLKRVKVDGLDGFAMRVGIGGGVFSILWLLISSAHLVRPWIAWTLTIISLFVWRNEILQGLRLLGLSRQYWKLGGSFERIWLFTALLLAANQIWFALSPPLKYDALTYHLAIPLQTIRDGGLVFTPANPYWGHPQLAEMLFTWSAALGSIEAAALAGWLFSFTAWVGIAGFAVRWFPGVSPDQHPAAVFSMALAALLSSSTVRWMTGWAYTDLFSALMGLGALSCFLAWRDSGRKDWLLLMGIFTGFAVSTKYTAGILALLLYPAAVVSPGINRRPFRLVFFSGLVSLCVFAPWAVKNLLFTGNPLFPYAIPTTYYSQARLAAANLPPESVDWLAAATFPISYTWTGIDSTPGPGTDLGPLLMLFGIPGLIIYWRSSKTRILAAGLGLMWLCVALAGARFGHLQQPRLYFALLPILGCTAGWGWHAVQEIQISRIRLRRLAGVLATLSLGLILLIDIPHLLASGSIQTVLGLRSRDTYLYDNTGAYYEAMQTLHSLPPDSKILMLWEGRSLYAPPNSFPDPWLDQWRTRVSEEKTAENILLSWQNKGYTHVLLYADGMNWMRASDRATNQAGWQEFDPLFSSLPSPLKLTGDHYLLYQIP